jgi:hypothetical protein
VVGAGLSIIYRFVRALFLGRERVVEVDLLVVPLDNTFAEEGDDALERWTVGVDGEPRRVDDPSVLLALLVSVVVLPAVLGTAVASPNLSNPPSSAGTSTSKSGGDIQGRVNGRRANWMTVRTRALKRRPVAQENMLTFRRIVLLPPPPR